MSFIQTLVLASSLLQLAAAAPALAVRSLSCPAAHGTTYTTGSSSYTIECGTDRNGGDMPAPNGQRANTLEDCIAQCQARSGCVLVDYVAGGKACYVKSQVGATKSNSAVIGAVLVTGSAPATTTAAVPTTAATTSTTSMAASTPTYASAPATGAGKRGLAFNKNPMTQFFGGSGSKVTWGYSWSSTAGSGVNSAIKYIPMLWGNSAEKTNTWKQNADAGIAAGADALLGFNEPDYQYEANMDVSASVTAWKTYMQPYAGKVRLGAPAVTNGGSPMGLTYLTNFLSSCSGCQIDFCPIHWYDSATNIGYFKGYLDQAHSACGGKPIWITEFGASGSEDDIATFLKTVLPWLDSLDYVERYAYFYDGASTDGTYLVNAAGTARSTIGEIFNSY